MLDLVLNAGLRWATKDRLSVFLFHAVPLRSAAVFPDLELQKFDRLLDYAQERFKFMPLHEAVQALKNNTLPPHAACLTFDDGYASWFEGVIPSLQRRGLHATFYITTGQFDGVPMWHERLVKIVEALTMPVLNMPGLGLHDLALRTLDDKRQSFRLLENFLKYQDLCVREKILQQLEQVAGIHFSCDDCMTVSQLRQLDSLGFEVGAHTRHHPILSLCDVNDSANEIAAVRETLEGLIGGKVRSFAYPNGRPGSDYTAEHVRQVKRAGYEHAVSTHWGAAKIGSSVYEIPRFTPWGQTPARMTWQIMRNIRTHTRVLGDVPRERLVSMVVENGSGFGGAVKALDTLLARMPSQKADFHVVSNIHVPSFESHDAVRSTHVIAHPRINTKLLSQRVRRMPIPDLAQKMVFFGLGRIDDLLNRLPYFLRLLKLAHRLKPDVIHGNNEPASNREAMLVAKLLKVPYVQHVRGSLNHLTPNAWTLKGADMFVPVSRWLAGDLLRLGAPAYKVRHVYDAIDTVQKSEQDACVMDDLRLRLGLQPDDILVAMIGMLVPWKGHDFFLDAVRALGGRAAQAHFLVIGGTPEQGDEQYAESLRAQTLSLSANRNVHFLGKMHDLPRCLPQVNIVVSASTEPEPLGLVMLEAMDAGCIFIAPAFGAATEVVVHRENGLLFEPRNVESLADVMAEAIDMVVRNDQAIDALCSKAQETVRLQFAYEKCAEATLRSYQAVL